MANEEVLGPRKTMFVLVIVVGCFAVLWPRILSPLMQGQGQMKPNQFDRDAGCCEVIFESEMAVLELVNEVCSSAVGTDGLLSAYAAAECRRTVNETCGLDIAAFLKRTDNVGKSTKVLLNTMKQSNSSCLKEHFGVPVWNLGAHTALNSWAIQEDNVKQERSPIRGAGPHPALRERGRAIPPGAPTPPSRGPVPMPPHARVRSPLSVYFDVDIKPPPIPGMRPPLGSPGGPVPAPKSSMGFVMPIYTICIIVFFVYTLSKLLFKRTGSIPYEHVAPDPQFRRRVFRDDSRTSPDSKLGPKERDAIVTAISGLVAEVHQQMEASYAQSQQRQESQENHTRPYTNGSVHSSPIIIASEYVEKEKTPEPELKTSELEEPSPEKEATPEPIPSPEKEGSLEPSPEKEASPAPKEPSLEKEPSAEPTPEKEASPEPSPEREPTPELEESEESPKRESERDHIDEELLKLSEDIKEKKDNLAKSTKDFLQEARENAEKTVELLREALKEDSPVEEEEEEEENDPENVSVKVMGMELTAHTAARAAAPAPAPAPAAARPHAADDVKSIFLETRIPQQSRVLVADFEDRAKPHKKHEPAVVSGKMTLSLIQDAPQEEDLPEIDPESTMDDFTTASAMTQPAAEKEGESSDEEVEEEIEIEEIEEEEEEEPEPEPEKTQK